MVYEELFLFQLKMQAFRALNRSRMDGVVHTADNATIREFVRTSRLSLPMRRRRWSWRFCMICAPLLHEPLASRRRRFGKTIVAAIALFTTVRSGFQGP